MQEERIEFDTAVLAKEKAFIGYKSNYHYRENKKDVLICGLMEDWTDHNLTKGYLSAPPQTVLKEWLKKEHNIIIEIGLDRTSYPKYCFSVYKYEDFGNWKEIKQEDWGLYRKEKEALEEALVLGLKNTNKSK